MKYKDTCTLNHVSPNDIRLIEEWVKDQEWWFKDTQKMIIACLAITINWKFYKTLNVQLFLDKIDYDLRIYKKHTRKK